MLDKKIGIVTYHHLQNEGSILQAYAQAIMLQEYFDNYKVEIVDYRIKIKEIAELWGILVSLIKLKEPIKRLKRYNLIKKYINKNLPLSKRRMYSNDYNKGLAFISNYDIVVAGGDEIWKIEFGKFARPFPNIYWLSPELHCKKIAIAASANRLNFKRLEKNKIHKISELINSFDLIGVRDNHSLDFLRFLNVSDSKFTKVPDPTICLRLSAKVDLSFKLKKMGVNLSQPILGVNFQGKKGKIGKFSKTIYSYFKQKGYQVIGISFSSDFIDVDLKSELTPWEWAHVFKYFDFCITDSFHTTVFSLKNDVPVFAVDYADYYLEIESKKLDFLRDMDLLYCYAHLSQLNDDAIIFEYIEYIEKMFDKSKIRIKLKFLEEKYFIFLRKVSHLLDTNNDRKLRSTI